MNTIKKDSIVKYINPFEDEVNVTYVVVYIYPDDNNYVLIEAQIGLTINPVYKANIKDIMIVE